MQEVPYDDRDGVIWMDGEFVPWRDAKLHFLSHALHYASCVFEGMRAYNGEIFELTAHNQRLHDSAKMLGFEVPYAVADLDDICREALEKAGYQDAYIRPAAWRGPEQMGVSAQNCKIHMGIAVWQWPSYFTPEARMKGIKIDWAIYNRPDPKTQPVHAKAGRPLYDLHPVQACGGSQRIFRRTDARLAWPVGGDHRCEHVPCHRRQDSHPDAGLFPGRDYPQDRRQPGACARLRSDRAGDHAGRAERRDRDVRDGDRCGGDADSADRRRPQLRGR